MIVKQHADAAQEFIKDEARTDWHDETLWFVRNKRDKAVNTLPEWEILREWASHIKDHTLSNLDHYLKSFEENCIDFTLTSPPYDNLRNYNGYNFDFENIAKQIFRVTKQGGVLVWVTNDATINGSETGTSYNQVLFFKSLY